MFASTPNVMLSVIRVHIFSLWNITFSDLRANLQSEVTTQVHNVAILGSHVTRLSERPVGSI